MVKRRNCKRIRTGKLRVRNRRTLAHVTGYCKVRRGLAAAADYRHGFYDPDTAVDSKHGLSP